MNNRQRVERIRSRLDHPVIDSDAHFDGVPPPRTLTFAHGFRARREMAADILQGAFGVLVQRGWLADDIFDVAQSYAGAGTPLFFADDVLIAAYLEHRGVRKVMARGVPIAELGKCVGGKSAGCTADRVGSMVPLHGAGRMTRNYRLAIPFIAKHLSVWPAFN